MPRAGRWVVAASMAAACALGACSRRRAPTQSPEAEAPATAPSASASNPLPEAATPVAAAAANEGDVARYPDETPLQHVLATTHAFASTARTQASPAGGAVVVTLKAQADVDEIAERQGFVLAYFVDPKDPSRKLMGWINKVDFASASGVTAARVVPDAGTTAPPPLVPVQRPFDVRQEHGTCPGGYARCGSMCRLQCGTAADCGGVGHCFRGLCLETGSAVCPR